MPHDQAGIPISEAAVRLGVSENAVRKRIRRKSLQAYKVDDRWYVVLDGLANDQAGDQAATTSHDQAAARPAGQDGHRELVDQLKGEVAFLRGQIEIKDRDLVEKDEQIRAWIDEAKRKDMMIAHLQERIVELPPGTPERPETRQEPPDEPQDIGPVYRIPEPVRRPWWAFWRQ